MEWREQTSVSCEEAYSEAQRWIEAVTKKTFGSKDFRSALENGVLLCELINKIKPGTIKRVNRLPTPIAGLDNLNVFLKACGKLGLKEAQLFHPGDLQDLSTRVTVKHQETSRRLKNVLITIYWLGRRAQCDRSYNGPYLNFKAFEGLLGTALYKALHESNDEKGPGIRDSGFGDSWYSEREEFYHLREEGGGEGGHRRDDSVDSLDSLGSRPRSISSDVTLKGGSEGCCSDAEADSIFRMAENKNSISYRRSVVITPKATAQFNQFLPTKDKQSGYVPAPLRKKRAEQDSRRSWASLSYSEDEGVLTSHNTQSALPAAHHQWGPDYESGSDSDTDRPDPDLVLDDLASRRFHSPSPAPPTNFAVPISPSAGGRAARGKEGPWPTVTVTASAAPQKNVTLDSKSRKMQSPKHSSVKVEQHQAVNTDSLFRDMYDDSEDEDDEVGYADPVHDDLYARKMGVKPQPANNASYNKFLPKFWTPEEDVHVQKIKLGSQRRPWYKKMQGFSRQKSSSSSDDSDCDISPWLSSAPSPSGKPPSHSHTHEASAHTTLVVGKREHDELESTDGSKSTSDIMEPMITQQNRFEELQKYREQIKQGEDKWQDDLSKWKTRRRSVNSDIVKKKEEREKIEQITYGSDRKSKTFKEMQEERDSRGKGSVGSRLKSLSLLDDEDDIFEKPTVSPHTRALFTRSYTIDTPYHSSESFEPSLKTHKPPAASPPTLRPASQKVEEVDSVSARQSSTATIGTPTPASHSSHSPAAAPEPKPKAEEHTSLTKTQAAARPASSFSFTQEEPEPKPSLLGAQTEAEAPSSGSLYKQPPLFSSMEPKPPAVSRVSASLPRSYQRSDSARLTSVVAPRPFGSQSSRITSLPRAYTQVDDDNKRVNGDVSVSKTASVPSRYQQFMTSEDEAQSSSAHSSEEEEKEEEERTKAESIPSTQNMSPIMVHPKNEAPVISAPPNDTSKENFCDMRISLNQKPNSSRDFGFHAAWDSTGARVTSIQPGSPAEMCQLQVGDEVLTVNGHKVAEMSYTEWRSCLETALQEGSLVMDVRRHGQNNWDIDQLSLPFKSHKTINLTSTDHPKLLGSSETKTVKPSLDFTSRILTETMPAKETPTHPFVDVTSNRVNGNVQEEPVTMRNKESEPLSLKNLKRRSEFFEQGGSESAVPDIPVPAITPSSSRWSWDPEEERKRQEKWQKEQERLLQEKYKRDQEKLQQEWLKAQQDIVTSGAQQEVNSHNMSPRAPPSSAHHPTPPLWEEEERKRKVEQERQRQAEEKRKREEEERELQQLQEEKKRREMQEEEGRMRMEEEKRRRMEEEKSRRIEEERRRMEEEKRKRLEEEERKRMEEERKRMEEEQLRWQRRREEEREEERRRQEAVEQQRRERALEQQQWTRSRSTPQLDEEDMPPRRGVHVQHGGMSHWLLKDKLTIARDRQNQSRITGAEHELDWRNDVNAMRCSEAEIVSGAGVTERKGQQPPSQAELERQQILREMKKTTSLLTDNSWIRQRSASTVTNREGDVPPMRRGESLDNLDASSNSWRSTRTPRGSSFVQNYSRPQSALYGNSSFYTGGSGVQRPASVTLPSSYSMGSLRVGAGTHSSSWSRQSLSTPSPTSPDPINEAGGPQQNNRSVSGKKICAFCDSPLGKGAAMIIESLELCYHLSCFKCIDCKVDLGGSKVGIEVRIRNKQLYCNSCYVRFKSAQPTSI